MAVRRPNEATAESPGPESLEGLFTALEAPLLGYALRLTGDREVAGQGAVRPRTIWRGRGKLTGIMRVPMEPLRRPRSPPQFRWLISPQAKEFRFSWGQFRPVPWWRLQVRRERGRARRPSMMTGRSKILEVRPMVSVSSPI